jgi:hypothetical protein
VSQIIGGNGTGVGGHMLGVGPNNTQVVNLFGPGDPNNSTDASVASASIGSTYSRIDGPSSTTCFYVKTVLGAGAGTWTSK